MLTPGQRDSLCLLAIIVATLLLRLSSLDRVVLNPDESQYEATATYLVSTGTSPFVYPLGAPGAYALVTALTRVFGFYPMFETRVLVQVVCMTVGALLFYLVSRETDRMFGLISGIAFVHYNMLYQGLTVNREWFVVLWVVAGIGVVSLALRRTGRVADLLWGTAGLITGLALMFKLQASFMVFAVPLALLLDGFARRDLRGTLRTLLPFGLGGLASGVVYLLPFLAAGSLGEFVGWVLEDFGVYVVGNQAEVRAGAPSTWALYFQRFYWLEPHRPLLLVAYLSGALAVGQAAARGLWPRRFQATLLTRPVVLMLVTYLLTAMVAVQLGNRFFAHYYILMLPGVAGVIGVGSAYLMARAPARPWLQSLAAVVLLALVADRALGLASAGVLAPPGVLFWVRALYLVAVALIVVYGLSDPRRRATVALAAWMVIEVLNLVALRQLTPTPPTMSHNPFRFEQLAAYLRGEAREGDRLFVWGWAPEIYSLAGIEAASHVTTSEYVVNDFLAAPERPSINARWANMMMQDLRNRQPTFVVDASRRSWTSTEMRFYDLGLYPEFEFVHWLEEYYRPVVELDGCVVYRRLMGSAEHPLPRVTRSYPRRQRQALAPPRSAVRPRDPARSIAADRGAVWSRSRLANTRSARSRWARSGPPGSRRGGCARSISRWVRGSCGIGRGRSGHAGSHRSGARDDGPHRTPPPTRAAPAQARKARPSREPRAALPGA